ncbi:MAG: T9SS type A sorting domain-containing protein, partial [Bacteroidia bacterium]
GNIYRTNNAGTSWTTVNSGTTDALGEIEFYNSNNGYIVGGNVANNTAKMLKTTDGGASWNNVALPSGTKRLTKIDFLDGNTAYAVGLNGTILKFTACPPTIVISTSSINASSHGACDGSANVNISSTSGTGYSCLWNTGHTTPHVSGLCAGTYIITVTDGLGFAAVDTVVITEPADSAFIDSTFILQTYSTNVTFPSNCDGTASVVATGGTPPYTYTWSTGDTTVSLSNLCSNVYYITVNDSNGQSLSSTVYVSEPNDTITDSINYPPIDTLYIDPIDTCIVDFTAPIDSAFITAFTITDSMTVLVDWTLWQNGVGVTITTEVEYTNMGFNLMVLTLHCSTIERELYSTVVQDVIDTNPVSTGINSMASYTNIKTYPNPFKDKLTIELGGTDRGTSDVNIKIMNSLGQTIYTTNQYLEKGNKYIVINTEKFNSGIYFVQTIFNGHANISKIMK